MRNKSLPSIKPEISQALSSLLDEIRSILDSKVLRAASTNMFTPKTRWFPSKSNLPNRCRLPQSKSCTLCKAAGRPHNTYYMSTCKFLPEADRCAIGRTQLVVDEEEEDTLEDTGYDELAVDDAPNAMLDQLPSTASTWCSHLFWMSTISITQ